MNKEPEISERFDVDDIRRLREYNSARFINMTPAEIVAETRAGAEKILELLEGQKANV